MEYLEKQIILDYHLRGEQTQLENDHPELAEKAKKYLGYELYYSLTKESGKFTNKDSAEYKKLMSMSDELDSWYHKEVETNIPHQK